MPARIVPGVTVEVAFGQTIGTGFDDLVWTDVTSHVRASAGITCSRGRAVTGQPATAGQLSLTLRNTDGRFTPGRDDGAYGTITTKVPVRVSFSTLHTGSVTGPLATDFAGEFDAIESDRYPLWTGFVTDWGWQVEDGQVVASLEATDIIATAARVVLKPWISGAILVYKAGFRDYWPLTDAETATTAINMIEGRPALTYDNLTAGTVTPGVTTDLVPDGDTSTALTPNGAGYGATLSGTTRLSSGHLAVSLWVRPTTLADGAGLVTVATSSAELLAATVTSTGQITIRENGITGTYGADGAVPNAAWSHVYVQRDHSQTTVFADRFRVWVNGVELSKTSGGASVSAATAYNADIAVGLTYGVPATAQFAHVATFATLNTDRVAPLSSRGTESPTCAQRFVDVARLTINQEALLSWVDADEFATVTMAQQATGGKTLLAVCQEIADVARGQLVATRDGKLWLVSAAATVAAADPLVTLSAGADVLTVDGGFGIDDADAVSEATVTLQPSGKTFVRSRTDPGLEAVSVDLWTNDAYQGESVADALVTIDPDTPRSPTVGLSMEWLTYAELVDTALAVELGDRIRITDLPSAAPATDVDLVVTSIEHQITASGWWVRWGTEAPQAGWILGDADRSLLGDTTTLRA